MAKDPITDYRKTQRIVLLIDLNPLLHLQDPTPYLTTLLSSTKTLLSFPPLSSSLFSFKPFFSSLSPLLSSSKLSPFHSSLALSFDLPDSTILFLSHFLSSLKETSILSNPSSSSTTSSRGFHVAASMRQLVHDYAWDPVFRDPVMGTILDFDDFTFVRSNLVVLFSPICGVLNSLSEFFDVGVADECLWDVGFFKLKFRGVFEGVNDAFVSRDIHFSWVDVKCELGSSEQSVEIGDSGLDLGVFESGIRDFGWGFCSTDSIVLGSALVPFGLIYPWITISSRCFGFNDSCKRVPVQLSLEILDVNGKPLECKCSDLELVDSKTLPRNRHEAFMNSQTGGNEPKKRSMVGPLWDRITKLHVKAVRRCDECVKIEGQLSNPVLVCELMEESCSDRKVKSSEFYADRVLEILAMEMGESVVRKPVPIWQILLSFLYREGYWALVSLSNGNGDLCMGILKPFTVFSALLCIVDDGLYPQNMVKEFVGVNVTPFIAKMNNEISKSNVDVKHSSRLIDSKSGPSSLDKRGVLNVDKRKTNKKNLHLLQDLTWSAFCKAASDHSEIDLEEVYFARGFNNSKRLKFLKCWMKQIKKSSNCSSVLPESSKPHEGIPKERNRRVIELDKESEQQISISAAVGENCLMEACKTQGKPASDSQSETLESFLGNLPNKIQQGLESEGVDVGALAERLVNSSVFWLYQKCEKENNPKSEISVLKSDDACGSIVAVELTKLLLKEPKDLAGLHKKIDPSSKASDQRSTGSASEIIVREYELQILFRMEILRSEVGESIEQPMKQKFVKQICWFLEAIQCHLQGGFFGDWSLDNYIGKTIKSRYCHTLGDVVHRIYTEMDLFLLSDEDEFPNNLLNSEDSNQSGKQKQGRDEMVDNRINKPVSVEDESLPLHENEIPQGIIREEHARRLIEARKSRERARRFASFTSWVPDLQRVWAPKQQKTMKAKSDPTQKLSKRKDHRRTSYDMVCETPMTGNKRSCSQENSIDDEDHEDYGTHSGGSVHKALFQEES